MSGNSSKASNNPEARRGAGAGKILRACVVQHGKVIEERRMGEREPVSIGTGNKNTFVIVDPALPKTHRVFSVKGGQYELVLTEGMRGKISKEGEAEPVDVATLKSQGLLQKKGDYYHLPLTEGHRGKVVIGDVTIIFQFIVPPPEPAKPQLPAAARGTLWQQIDWPYAFALMAALAVEVPFIIYFQYAPAPKEVSLDDIGDRWAKLIVPEMPKKKAPPPKEEGEAEKAKQVAKKQEEAPKEKKEEPKEDEAAKAKAKAERAKKIRKSIENKGVLAIFGTTGTGGAGGAVADVFSEGGIGGDLDSAFEGIAGVGIATDNRKTKRGGGAGEAASIGGLATKGGGKVGLGSKTENRVGAVEAAAPAVDGALDSDSIARVVKGRLRMVTDCYNRELKRDPSLAGKVEVEFTIDETGKISDAFVITNTMGSDAVGNCILGRLRRWRFPQPDGGSVTVSYPFIFSPSS